MIYPKKIKAKKTDKIIKILLILTFRNSYFIINNK